MYDILSIILLTQFYASFELESRIPCFSTKMRLVQRSFSFDQLLDQKSMDVREIGFYVKTPPSLDRC